MYQAKKKGKKPDWNCDEWLEKTNVKTLPEKVGYPKHNKTTTKKFSREELKKCENDVCYGPRGGKYIIKKGIKIYIK
jgi:hypothetical protein